MNPNNEPLLGQTVIYVNDQGEQRTGLIIGRSQTGRQNLVVFSDYRDPLVEKVYGVPFSGRENEPYSWHFPSQKPVDELMQYIGI